LLRTSQSPRGKKESILYGELEEGYFVKKYDNVVILSLGENVRNEV
jgi:hypothetical protein